MEDFKKDAPEAEINLEDVVEELATETEMDAAQETPNPESIAGDSEIETLKEALNQKSDALARTMAEYQNYRKRVEKEKQDLMKYANEKIMKDLIQVHDNFERAIGAMDKENEALTSVINGVEMIKKSFDDILERYGISEVDAVGQPFNPDHHHAVMTEEREGVEANTVLEVFQKGYKLHEKVIRPSMVKVSE